MKYSSIATSPDKPETIPPSAYLSLKLDTAVRSGPRSVGYVRYRILSDADRQQLFLTFKRNNDLRQ